MVLDQQANTADESWSFAEADTECALALYRRLLQRPGNLFFSPFSVRAALAMAYAGAKGETAAQMDTVLRFGATEQTLHDGFAEIIQRLNAGAGECEMILANSLWAQDSAPLRSGFLDLISRSYGADVHVVDFQRGAEAACLAINQWAEDHTKQKIRNLLSPAGLDSDTRLLLANAVYFKGMWECRFDEDHTKHEPFYLEDGSEVEVPLMYERQEVRHFRARSYQAVELGYRGGDLCMLVLLPDKRDGLRDLEASIATRMLHDCVDKMRVRDVDVFLPKFKVTWEVAFDTELRALGMSHAFTRLQADFSGINGYKPPHQDAFFISNILQKAFVDVNEKGTEAAAVTQISFETFGAVSSGPRVPLFRADHPFLFAIRHRKSGILLFLGRIADPTRT